MAELQTSEMVTPSVQEQAAADNSEAMAQKWDDNRAALEQQVGGGTEEVEEPRPGWLPEKFNSPEDMANAYNELETKLGAGEESTGETTEETPEGEVPEVYASINQATEEFMESGNLSDETFKGLEESGLPRELVESYIAGQQALSEGQTTQVYDAVGGSESYAAMAEWATESLDAASVDAFNQVVEGGTVEQAKMAAQGLYAQYQAANGGAPKLVQGATTGQAVLPFTSSKQVSNAMNDIRYKNDPGFQQEVQQRLAVSNVL